MRRYIVLSVLLLSFALAVNGQEYLLPLQTNAALKLRPGKTLPLNLKAGNALELPFRDDFSTTSVYPDSTKWMDRWVFVNRTYGIRPPTVGMATFDALDDTGSVYSWAASTPFLADFLTSRPIRLDSILTGTPDILQVSDSLYFSFYYQPQGLANNPDAGDSLLLEFYNPATGKWDKIWGQSGMTYSDFLAKFGSSFKLVMIPILNTDYFKPDFQFRFKNYASIVNNSFPSWQSNMDEWNIDYVYLNYNRLKIDTTFRDVAFVEGAESMLKNYMQMPARQYNPSELKDTFHLKMTNLAETGLSNLISYQYDVNEIGGGFSYTKAGGVANIFPYIDSGYHNWPYHVKPAVGFTLPAMSNDSMAFVVTHTIGINGWTDQILANDTIRYKQEFYNYYAYDDGTAELGYGLASSGSRLAYKFTLNNTDTLGGIQMFFNQTVQSPGSRYFYIVVWSSLNPETIIYKSSRTRPYTIDSLNTFYTYFITDTTLILSGTFYVGWQQITDEVLNIGFDRNTNSYSNIFFNTEGTWQNTSYNGSIMLRPVFGTAGQTKKMQEPVSNIRIYPNPVGKGQNGDGNTLNISLPDKYLLLNPEKTMTLEVFNCLGAKVIETAFNPELDITNLQKGFYILRLNSYATSESFKLPFVIAR